MLLPLEVLPAPYRAALRCYVKECITLLASPPGDDPRLYRPERHVLPITPRRININLSCALHPGFEPGLSGAKNQRATATLTEIKYSIMWSGMQDLNLHSSAPKADGFPNFPNTG